MTCRAAFRIVSRRNSSTRTALDSGASASSENRGVSRLTIRSFYTSPDPAPAPPRLATHAPNPKGVPDPTSPCERISRWTGMPESPPTIGRFEIVREIGRGAMGVVYEARDPVLGRAIALKVIQPASAVEEAPFFEERFLAEARIAARLQHPGIVVVHDVGRDPDTGALYIALELLRGQTLADLTREGPVEWREALRLVAQVARALHHAHVQGVVHRDVKPANVMVLPTGEAKVMDFGIARLESARQRLTTTGQFLGTPLFTAPEQARAEEVDARADIFSLASVAYTLLTAQPAFAAPTIPGIVHRVVYEDPVPPSQLVAGLPSALERVLSRALAKELQARYPTAEAFAEDLDDVRAGRAPRHAGAEDEADSPLAALVADTRARAAPSGTVVSPAPAPPGPAPPMPASPPSPAGRRTRRWALAACAVALVVAALGYLALRRGRGPSSEPSPSAPLLGPLSSLLPEALGAPGHLRILFDHQLRSCTLRVFVDDHGITEERLNGQRRKTLGLNLYEGRYQDEFQVAPGLHEVRVEVRWDENVRRERIVGNFRPGATRTVEAKLGRIRRDLSLEWR